MKERLILSAAVLGVIGVIAACSTPDLGSVDTPDSDAGAECKRGEHQACTCADGKTSSKTCSSAGRYLECACEPTKAACGDGTCDPDETCKDCPSDCGACPVCAEARSCKSGAAAPGQVKSTPTLDVKLEAMPKERILADLVAAAERGEPGLVTISEALGVEPARSPVVAKLRAVLGDRPALVGKLRRQLARPELTSAFARARLAPVHAGATSAPAIPRTMSGDAGSMPEGGLGEAGAPVVCDPPRLRVRLAKVTVTKTEDDFAKDIVYCFLTSESAAATEGVQGSHTAPTENLSEGQSHSYGATEAIFWGVKEPKDAAGDLTLKYECWEQDDPTQYEALVGKAAQLLADEYAYQEGNGWTSSTLDLAARFLPALVSLDGDDHLFSATQTIPRSMQLGLANGAGWNVRKSGTHLWSDWDWTLRVEAWGCVDNGYVQ
jgi:hypothetical protein